MDPSVVSFCLEGARRFLVERHFGESPTPLPDGRLLSCEKSRLSSFISFVFIYFQCSALLFLCSFVLTKRDKNRQTPFLRGSPFCRLVCSPSFVRYKSPFVRSSDRHMTARFRLHLQEMSCGQKTTPLRRVKKSCGSLHQSPFGWGIVRTAVGTHPLFTQKHRPRPGCRVGYPFFSGIWL